jgi:hypothetical protein
VKRGIGITLRKHGEVRCETCRHLRLTPDHRLMCGHWASPDPVGCTQHDDAARHKEPPRRMAR